MSIPATGRIESGASGHDIVIDRTLNAPITDVWRSIVEPDRMNRWIGTWSGEAGPGKRVMFTMTAEGDDVEPEEALIHACEAPRLLDVETFQGDASWRMRLELTEEDGKTRLAFRQSANLDEDVTSYGPGWEYYLDRLVAVHTGDPFAEWDAYYPAQLDHWQREVERNRVSVG